MTEPVWILRCLWNSIYFETLLAIRTGEWFFTSVNSQMRIQCANVSELLVTIRAVEWLFNIVKSIYDAHSKCFLFEFLVTLNTDERLFTSVNSTLLLQIHNCFELLFTPWTDERLITSVDSTMHIQIATICERLVAVRTDEWLTIERHSRLNNDKYLTMIGKQGRPQATWRPRQSSLVIWAVMCEK